MRHLCCVDGRHVSNEAFLLFPVIENRQFFSNNGMQHLALSLACISSIRVLERRYRGNAWVGCLLLLRAFGDASIAGKQNSIPRFIFSQNNYLLNVLLLCVVGDCMA